MKIKLETFKLGNFKLGKQIEINVKNSVISIREMWQICYQNYLPIVGMFSAHFWAYDLTLVGLFPHMLCIPFWAPLGSFHVGPATWAPCGANLPILGLRP